MIPNRKSRRRMQSLQRKRWQDGMGAFHQQMLDGQFGEFGAFELFVVRPYTRPPASFVDAVVRWGRAIDDGDKPLCMCCPHEFRPGGDPPECWTLAVPVHAKPTMAVLTALCERCSRQSDDEIIVAAHRAYKRMGLAVEMAQTGTA